MSSSVAHQRISAAARALVACERRVMSTRAADWLAKADRKGHGRAGKSPGAAGEKRSQHRPSGTGFARLPCARHARPSANERSSDKGGKWNAPFLSFLDKLDESPDGLAVGGTDPIR